MKKIAITCAEALIEMTISIKQCFKWKTSDKSHGALNYLKDLYLSGAFDISSLIAVKKYVIEAWPEHVGLRKRIEKIIGSVEKGDKILQTNDNLYGRAMESFVAAHAVHNPTDEMKDITNKLMNKMTELYIDDGIFSVLIEQMSRDPPAWRNSIPEVADFMEKRNYESFSSMCNVQSVYRQLLCQHLLVKIVLTNKKLNGLVLAATKWYRSIVEPHKPVENAACPKNEYDCGIGNLIRRGIFNKYNGLLLEHQIALLEDVCEEELAGLVSSYTGLRPVDRSCHIVMTSRQDINAIAAEKAVVCGLSGSSNLAKFYYEFINPGGDLFNINVANFLTMVMLTYSGGHSFNESMNVFYYDSEYKPKSWKVLAAVIPPARASIYDGYDKLIRIAETKIAKDQKKIAKNRNAIFPEWLMQPSKPPKQ